jgi:hypothetical protein
MAIVGNMSTGEFTLSGSAQQLPDVTCERVTIKALSTNTHSMYVGGAGVTAANGTTDLTTGLELAKSEEITLEVPTMQQLWVIGTAAEGLTYIAER